MPSQLRILISEPNSVGSVSLPYAWAVLKSYWDHHGADPGTVTWIDPIFERQTVGEHLSRTAPPDVLGLSCYTWNWDLQCEVARWAKEVNPHCLVVAGGPDPDYKDRAFFSKHPYIDMIVVKDGEIPFTRILETVLKGERDFRQIGGLYLPLTPSSFEVLQPSGAPHFFTGPTEVPTVFDHSPYIENSGLFERVMAAHRGKTVQATWETNRGCPYSCSFCDWGSSTMSKVRKFDMARVEAEAEWFGRLGVPFVHLADANFGILPRDIDIAERMASVREKYGFPKTLFYSAAKNNPDRVVEIAKRIYIAGLKNQHILAVQHTDEDVLAATERSNIPAQKYREVVTKLAETGMPSEVQLILGIPGDTPEKWKSCFAEIMDWGVHESYQVSPYQLLPNAPAADPKYREKWQIETVDRELVLFGGIRLKTAGFVKSTLIVSSKTYSREDWVEMSTYAAFIKAWHNGALARLPVMYLHFTHGVPWRELYGAVIDEFARKSPVMAPLYARVQSAFDDLQRNPEGSDQLELEDFPNCAFCVDPAKWLFVKTCVRIKEFYAELSRFLTSRFPEAKNLQSAIDYQRNLLILPDFSAETGRVFPIRHDWPEYFRRAHSLGRYEPLPEPDTFLLPHVAEVHDQEVPARSERLNFGSGNPSPETRWYRWLESTVTQCNFSAPFSNFMHVRIRRGMTIPGFGRGASESDFRRQVLEYPGLESQRPTHAGGGVAATSSGA